LALFFRCIRKKDCDFSLDIIKKKIGCLKKDPF